MNLDNQKITIDYKDFKKIIRDEVKKELMKHKDPVYPGQLFPSPRAVTKGLEKINRENPSVRRSIFKEVFKENKMLYVHATEEKIIEVSERDYSFRKPIDGKREFSSGDHLHNSIRSLSLAVFGQTLNRDLEQQDYQYAYGYYNRFLETFNECYRDRTNREYPFDRKEEETE